MITEDSRTVMWKNCSELTKNFMQYLTGIQLPLKQILLTQFKNKIRSFICKLLYVVVCKYVQNVKNVHNA